MSTRVEISRVFSVTAAASGITTCSIHNNTHAFVGHILRYDHHVWLFHFLKDTHITSPSLTFGIPERDQVRAAHNRNLWIPV